MLNRGGNSAVETLTTNCLSAECFCSCGIPQKLPERILLTAVQGCNRDYQALKMVPINCCCVFFWLVQSETPTVGVCVFNCVQQRRPNYSTKGRAAAGFCSNRATATESSGSRLVKICLLNWLEQNSGCTRPFCGIAWTSLVYSVNALYQDRDHRLMM